MKHDVIDHMTISITSKLKQANLERNVLESILQVIKEEAEDARNTFAGSIYIRHDNQEVKKAYLLWQQQKKTTKNMKEIYVYIANSIGDVSESTIRAYVSKFVRGFNPYANSL